MNLPTLIILAIIAISLLLNVIFARVLSSRSRQIKQLKQHNQTQKKELANVKHRQQIAHDAYRFDADELDKRLQQDYRD